MKRILVLCLLSALLLCACGERVPVYEQPEPSLPSQKTDPPESESLPETAALSEPDTVLSVPKDTSMLRLEGQMSVTQDSVYFANIWLTRYNEEKDYHDICCPLENCSHADETCPAWLGDEWEYLRFAVREDTAFLVRGNLDDHAELSELEFCSVSLTDGQRRSYYSIAAQEGQRILLGDVLVCGNTALLSYALGAAYDLQAPDVKTQYILAFDLTDGEMIRVMEHEIDYGSTYDLWGMNESHLILAYHHSGVSFSYGSYCAMEISGYDYDEYTRDAHRWVLLEYPIEENAMWSEQVAAHEAATELALFSYRSFYKGKLYYIANSYVKVYDLSTHNNDYLFYQPEISHMYCADGKLFYSTHADEYFYYDLEAGISCQYQKTSAKELFSIVYEMDDSFFGKYHPASNDGGWRKLSKEDFYEENYEAGLIYPYA